MDLATAGDRYSLTAPSLDANRAQLNGRDLALGTNDELPPLGGMREPAGRVVLPPASITFFSFLDAGNANCR
jgi:hypothetical protein